MTLIKRTTDIKVMSLSSPAQLPDWTVGLDHECETGMKVGLMRICFIMVTCPMSHASLWSHVQITCPMLHYGPMSDHMSPGHVLLQIKPGVASCNSARWTHTDTSPGTPVSPSPTTLSVACIKIKLSMIANFNILHKRLADSLCSVLVGLAEAEWST